ncbi:MAG: 5-deoxy-glucuronate isomerase [Propionibacteriaceae bacterium]|jgi:5-deoxy-glucuronate isomerase|nr:5-deoxy-glucuronate isomerase [Propionibacteriaceae bacterium]
MSDWYFPAGSTASAGWSTLVDSEIPGWVYTGVRTAELSDGREISLDALPFEHIVLPLAGSFQVDVEGKTFELKGRPNVWSGTTDLVYVGPKTAFTVRGDGRFAVCSAKTDTPREAFYQAAEVTPIENRGTGNMSREVRNFGTPGVLEAGSIIACEVLTPAGNWSSYPPHKHDEELEGIETQLEEIYYFELRTNSEGAPEPERSAPLGYQRVSASDSREIDVLAEVHDRDTVLVPFGWHGPSMAAPGYDMYYLNVMSGPGRERAWRITDHPDQTWLRSIWPTQDVDPRLPFN